MTRFNEAQHPRQESSPINSGRFASKENSDPVGELDSGEGDTEPFDDPMDSNVFYTPEKFGLRVVATAEYGSGYEYDTVVVFVDDSTGEFFLAQDSGCSCPTPFEGQGRSDLTPVGTLRDLMDVLDPKITYARESDQYDPEGREGEAAVNASIAITQAFIAARSAMRDGGEGDEGEESSP